MIRTTGISEIQLLNIERIDKIMYDLFTNNPAIGEISATDAMPFLRKYGIFIKFHPLNSMPLRNLLRLLEKENQLSLFRLVRVGRKKRNNRLYFFKQNDETDKQS